MLIPYGALNHDIWTDEAYSISYTFHPSLLELLEDVRKNEETPPLYFVLLWVWARLLGHSELALRLPSLIYGILAVVLFSQLARRWLAPAAAVFATALFATTPMMLEYELEIRQYMLVVLLAVVTLDRFEQLYQQPERWRNYATYALAAVALLYTSYFSLGLLLAQNVIWALRLLRQQEHRRQRLRGWVTAQLAIAAMMLPWLPSLLYQMQVAEDVTSFWGEGLGDYFLLALTALAGSPTQAWLLLWIVIASLSWMLITAGLLRSAEDDKGRILRAFGIPALVLFAILIALRAIATRYSIVLMPGAALAAAAGWQGLRGPLARLKPALPAILVGGLLFFRIAGVSIPQPIKPWTELTAHVMQHVQPDDTVIFHPPWDQRVFEYYYRGPALRLVGAHHYDDFYSYQGYSLRTTWTEGEAVAALQGSRRIWLFYDQLDHDVPPLKLPYTLKGHWRSDKLELLLYEVPNT